MKRLLLAVSLVAASYVVLQPEPSALDPPTSGSDQGPTSVSDNLPANSGSQAKQMTSTQSFSDAPDKPLQLAEQSETSRSPDVYGEPNWVEVLMPARVHTGPSVDTTIIRFYAVGTPLRVVDYRGGWFEIIEPSTSKSGWIYSKYLGAISNPDQTQIASQEQPVQKVIAAEVSVPAKRYAKATRPVRVHHEEMASLLQQAFSGY